jgi:CubicO group peptidase (beta-lactamase class C family)
MKIAFSPQSFEHKGVRNYGLGFRILLEKDQKTARYIYHNGWWKGYNTLFWFCPKKKSLIVILSNVKNKGIYSIKPFIKVLEPQAEMEKDEGDEE